MIYSFKIKTDFDDYSDNTNIYKFVGEVTCDNEDAEHFMEHLKSREHTSLSRLHPWLAGSISIYAIDLTCDPYTDNSRKAFVKFSIVGQASYCGKRVTNMSFEIV